MSAHAPAGHVSGRLCRQSGAPSAAHRGGFTIIELLIVLAVVSVLVTIAASSLSAMIAHNRLASSGNELLSSLYLLRSEAAKRNRIMKMCRRPSNGLSVCDTQPGRWDAGWILWADDDNDSQVDPDETIVSEHQGFRGTVQLTGNASVASRIAFQPIGGVSGVGNGTFTACVPGSLRERQIIISKAGRMRTRDLQGDGFCE